MDPTLCTEVWLDWTRSAGALLSVRRLAPSPSLTSVLMETRDILETFSTMSSTVWTRRGESRSSLLPW